MMLRVAAARMSFWLRAILRHHTFRSPRNALSRSQTRLLKALMQGGTLKSHRYFDGSKEYLLHTLNGETSLILKQDVRPLEDMGFLLTNHKFPAATLFLSTRGRCAADEAMEAAGESKTAKFPAAASR